jgi:signal transduction histidine kinase
MEARIAAMLDEKDVMLGAIGHDLKTPLAALRVRIESVPDKIQRQKMAASIEDITATLDDILTLSRVGRDASGRETVDLGKLALGVVEEFEDLGDPVTIAELPRIVAEVQVTWIRRALRNLVSNAVRYGEAARISILRDGDMAVLRVEDDGPGIAPDRIEEMMQPFTRGEASRNRATGGAGLGLTLARAIAQQHGGDLVLANREGGGLSAELRLPI